MYEAIFVSDAHIGSSKYAHEFLTFLETIKSKKIFLVGDIIDSVCDEVDRELEAFFTILNKKDAAIYYILGNHEKENPHFQKFKPYLQDIPIYSSYLYKYNNLTIYIEHGDSFHQKDTFNKLLKLGLYKFKKTLLANKNKKAKLKTKKGLYYKIKPLIRAILYNSYINYIIQQAHKQNASVAICGHLHHLEQKKKNGINYLNCGDWLKYKSYIAMHSDGTLTIKRFKL